MSADRNTAGEKTELGKGPGIRFPRYFTIADDDPYDLIEWDSRTALITNNTGEAVFEQRDVRTPTAWSQQAINIVASMYFRGKPDSPERESDIGGLIDRVVNRITSWGYAGGYFRSPEDRDAFQNELKHLIVHQKASFNSPVWFNCGHRENPQCSACFIIAVEDSMESILDLAKTEGMLFKHGSGTGSNLSALRSSGETLNGGGTASGPVSFMKGFDAFAGVIKSGGSCLTGSQPVYTTGGPVRAAELAERENGFVCMSWDPPSGGFKTKHAHAWLSGVKTVLRVRTDGGEFDVSSDHPFRLADGETVTAENLRTDAVLHTYRGATDGPQTPLRVLGVDPLGSMPVYSVEVDCPTADDKTAASGHNFVIWPDDRRDGAGVVVHNTRRAAKMVILNANHPDIVNFIECKAREEKKAWALIDAGYDSSITGDAYTSIFFQNANNSVRVTDAFMKAVADDDPWETLSVTGEQRVVKTYQARDLMRRIAEAAHVCGDPGMQFDTTVNEWHTCPRTDRIRASNPCCFTGDTEVLTTRGRIPIRQLAEMTEQGLVPPKAVTQDPRQGQRVEKQITRAWSTGMAMDTVLVETKLGLRIECTPEHLFYVWDGTFGDQAVEARNLRRGMAVIDENRRRADDRVKQITPMKGRNIEVFDLEVEDVHRFAVTSPGNAHGAIVSNSEYMFIDDSACNLASINLMKFEDPEHGFDTEAFTAAVRTIITAQEIMVGNASYPTPAIERNSHDYRPLGLGYCNLGAFLMSQALPYDSDDGRAAAGAITALMTGAAYEQSAIIARDAGGPFHGFERNREPFLKVMKKHAGAVHLIESGSHKPSERIAAAATRAWQAAIGIGSEHGFRNAQATVLAPTGCLVGSTLVSTSKGLVRLSTLGDPSGDQWQDTDFMVDAGDGPRRATKFFANGRKPIHRIVTKSGYTLRGTPDHKVKIVSSEGEWVWRTLADVHPDDQLPLRLGMAMDRPNEVDLPPSPTDLHHNVTKEFTTPRSMTPELAEFAGFFMGNGSLHTKGLRLAVYGLDTDVINHLTKLAKTLFGLTARPEECGSYVSLNLNSVPLTAWWASCAFDKISTKPGKGKCPRLPDAVLASNNISVYTGFIRGLYEADGTSASGYPSWSSARLSFAEDVQTLLLALGYPSRRRQYESGLGSTIQEVRLLNTAYAERFMAEIGFIGARKTAAVEAVERAGQTPRQDRIPLPRRLVDQLTSPGEETGIRKMLLHGLRKKGSVPRPTLTELRRLSDPLVPGTKELDSLLGFFYEKVVLSVPAGEAETFDLSVPENVTYVANGFVSHNTIGFMMDCDTTGVEPDIALVKYKKLVNQGLMKIVNQTVPKALKRLCYDEKTARAILEHIETGGTIENAPGFAEEDLDIFDCAFKPQNGERSIAPSGHIRMIGAVQPFISGAISKTINMPTDTTVDEIERTYIDAWKQGAKSVSIYRDGSKRSQPLTTGEDEESTDTEEHPKPIRRRLADERRSITHKFEVGGHEGYVTVGIYKDGTPGEIFIVMAKEGSTISGFADAFAQAISYALQYGVPLEMLVNKFCHQRFEPAGMTRNPKIRMAKSIVDYIVRWMATKFLDEDAQRAIGINLPEKPTTDDGPAGAAPTGTTESAPGETAHPMAMIAAHLLPNDQDAPPCPACGSIMLRNGTCYACQNCGRTSGCS